MRWMVLPAALAIPVPGPWMGTGCPVQPHPVPHDDLGHHLMTFMGVGGGASRSVHNRIPTVPAVKPSFMFGRCASRVSPGFQESHEDFQERRGSGRPFSRASG